MTFTDSVHPSNLSKFPNELSKAIIGLNNGNRQKILLALFPTRKLSFSELVDKTKIDGSLISTHLRILKDSMLIEQFYEHIIGRDEYSFYRITKYGVRILNGLFNVFYIIKRKREIEFSLKITDEVTGLSPDAYVTLGDSRQEFSDTAEQIKKIVDELVRK